MITDRDIVIRTLALGKNPLECTAKDAMSDHPETVRADMKLDECLKVMEQHQIRRVPVLDEQGQFCGIIAQADIALHAPQRKSAEVLHEISLPA
jgi:CBS domain-containing protein